MSAWIVVVIAAVAILMALFVGLRSKFTQTKEGKMMAFVGLLILPTICVGLGFEEQMTRAESTNFCLSCHVMNDFGHSLYVDDKSYIPAVHYQNNFVPRDHACYTCHTNYAMFGTVKAKWGGMHHLLVQYLGTIPKPEDIKPYEPYNNRECLHCHLGSRRFEENDGHLKTPTLLADIKANRLTCTSSKCHDTVHDVGTLKDSTFWKPGSTK